MKKLFIILLSTLSAFSQKIEKVQDFVYLNTEKTPPNRASIYNISLNSESNVFKVYTWQPLGGSIIESTDKKSKAGKVLGGISTISGNSEVTYTPLISSHFFNENLKFEKSSASFISAISLDPRLKYKMDFPALYSTKDYPSTYSIVDYKNFLNDNPDFEKSLPIDFGYTLVSKGEGFGGRKNMKIYLNSFENTFELKNANLVRKYINKDIQKEKWEKEFVNYNLINQKNSVSTIGNGTFVQALNKVDEKDSFYYMKNFSFINYDKEGNILNKEEFIPQYLKIIKETLPVYDETGMRSGILYILGSTPVLGQKKLKDPIDNNYRFIYFGKDGKLKFNIEISHGENPDKSFHINPMLVLEKDNQLHVFNQHFTSLIKSFNEIIVLDSNGKVNLSNEQKQKASFPLTDFYTSNIIPHNDKLIDYSFETETKEEKVNELSTKKITYYKGIRLSEFDKNFKVNYNKQIVQIKPTRTPIFEKLIDYNGKKFLIFTYENGNTIVNLDEKKTILNVLPKEAYIPTSSTITHNFSFDEKKGFLYFIYEGNKYGTGQIIKVNLNL